MAKTIDYYLSLNSPWAYLGGPRLEQIAARHNAEIRVKPVDFGVIFPRTGGLPLGKRAPERQAYRLVDLERWRKVLGMQLNLHPTHFPADERSAAALVIASSEGGADTVKLAHAILRAVWAEERDIADKGTLEAILTEAGFGQSDLLERMQDPAIAARREALTEEALGRGVFGAPTYVYRDELFWGQDRLELLDRALAD